jgi:sulfoxide reductase heme-binding subunit YedZ
VIGGMPGLWYLNRATGLVLLVLLTVTLVLGLRSRRRSPGRFWPRFATARLHQNLAVLSVAVLTAHVGAAVLDSYVPIRAIDAVVPFVSAYRPLWLGLGTLASTGLLMAILSATTRHTSTRRTWRGLHLLVYLAWPLALLHGLGTGTDTRNPAVLLLCAGCAAAVLVAAGVRLAGLPAPVMVRGGALALLLLVPLAVAVWLRTGPLAPGWSHKAGTPPPASAPSSP